MRRGRQYIIACSEHEKRSSQINLAAEVEGDLMRGLIRAMKQDVTK